MMKVTDEMVNRFLSWQLPESVCADACASMRPYAHQRSGTNLLTAAEARQMLEHVLSGTARPEGEQKINLWAILHETCKTCGRDVSLKDDAREPHEDEQ